MAEPVIKHFLIVFDREAGKQLRLEEFTDVDRAMAAYEAAERAKGDNRWIDVVLLGADSLETAKATHGSWFREGITAANLEDHLREFVEGYGLTWTAPSWA
ncbi:hypothetical protein [uncultured Tessaracoccus sp.]|uniref:hypothetical protein n=1 Tax=uncultured Tessaracoccus sp. TaxID=905023 RepID=UPI0025DE647C|nr:hypothetical protein [uncultured Tessaracoccus sp.]